MGKTSRTTTPRRRQYGGLSSEERSAERRRRLMAAGLKLFGKDGYGSTSIEALCAAARVTTRHFYEEFKHREVLLAAIYDQVLSDALSAVELALADAPEDDLYGRARAGVGAFVHAMLDDPRRARIVCVEVVGVSARLEKHRRPALHRFAHIVENEARRAAGKGLIGDRDPGLASVALVGGTYEVLVEVLGKRKVETDELIEELSRFFVAVASAG